MGTTLQDIADQLQISKATVSRALRHDPLIHPKTRAKVRATALQMGYEGQPRGARRGAHQRVEKAEKPTIGLLFHASSLTAAQHDLNLVKTMEGVMKIG